MSSDKVVTSRLPPVVSRVAIFAMKGVVVLTLALLLYYTYALVFLAPLDGVEGDILYEASRVARGLPLYVDPLVGALDEGTPPTRFYVLYPPLWSSFIAIFGGRAHAVRLFAGLTWILSIGLIAMRSSEERRREALWAGLAVLGVAVYAQFAFTARPDAPAILFVALALARTLQKGEPDALVGAFLGAAFVTKPNVVGVGFGIGASLLLSNRKRLVPFVSGGLLVVAVASVVLHVVSKGVWLEHLLRSTMQSFSLWVWKDAMVTRLPCFLLPWLAIVFLGFRERERPLVRVMLGAAIASFVACVIALGKTGKASNYWLEPTVATLALFVSLKEPVAPRMAPWSLVALLQLVYVDAITLSRAREAPPIFRAKQALLETARRRCLGPSGSFVVTDETGTDIEINGRFLVTPFQFNHLRNRMPELIHKWREDWSSAGVTCFVSQDRSRFMRTEEPIPAQVFYPDEIKTYLRAEFEPIADAAGWTLFQRKERALRPSP